MINIVYALSCAVMCLVFLGCSSIPKGKTDKQAGLNNNMCFRVDLAEGGSTILSRSFTTFGTEDFTLSMPLADGDHSYLDIVELTGKTVSWPTTNAVKLDCIVKLNTQSDSWKDRDRETVTRSNSTLKLNRPVCVFDNGEQKMFLTLCKAG